MPRKKKIILSQYVFTFCEENGKKVFYVKNPPLDMMEMKHDLMQIFHRAGDMMGLSEQDL